MMMGPQRIALLVALAALAADIVADPVADPGHPIHGDEIVDVTFPPGGAKLGLAFYRPLVPPTISLVAPGSLAAATAPSLRPGLQLWAVNGQPVAGLSFADAVSLLRTAQRPIALRFVPPPARSAAGEWLDHGEVAVAAAAGDDAALTKALHKLGEDDAYALLEYITPRVPAVARGLRRLVRSGHSWADPRLQRESGLALTLVGDYAAAHAVLDAIVQNLPDADAQDGWRQPLLLGRLQCAQGLQASCLRSLRQAVQSADAFVHVGAGGTGKRYTGERR